MWTSIYVANNKAQADKMQMALETEGFMTNVRSVGHEALHSAIFEVQVLESEAEEAQSVICRVGLGS